MNTAKALMMAARRPDSASGGGLHKLSPNLAPRAARNVHLLLVASAVVSIGCASKTQSADPEVLRVGVLPDDAPEELQRRNAPLLAYLSSALNRRFDLIIPLTYEEFERDAEAGRYDLVYFGGYTFVQQRSGFVPLVMRDIDTKFVSYLLVRRDDPAQTIMDLRGRKLIFGSRLSTSGHLMPRYFLKEMGIRPEEFFAEVRYSGSHDRTAAAVLSKEADVGAANSQVIDNMLQTGRLRRNSLRILWRTPPYPDYVWAVSKDLDKKLRGQLLEAFLDLSQADVRHREILAHQGTRFFLPAAAEDFVPLERIAEEIGLLGSGP
jgi:phosphonate transport system substrate-binding protein